MDQIGWEKMKTIWKYIISAGKEEIKLPKGAEVLSVHEQNDEVAMWVSVDPSLETESRYFRMFGTGHALSERPMKYIGTAHLHGGQLVLHVFELIVGQE